MMAPQIIERRVSWPKVYRIIRTAHGAVNLLDDVADYSDWNKVVESALNTKFYTRNQIRQSRSIPDSRKVIFGSRASGETIMGVMAPFIRCSTKYPSRFSDGSYGVWYGAEKEETALAESVHHYKKFMEATPRRRTKSFISDYEVLLSSVHCKLHDVNNVPGALSTRTYSHSQKLGALLRNQDSNGVLWNSVRHPEGRCVGLFWPDVVGRPIKKSTKYIYHWTGKGDVIIRNCHTGELLKAN